MINLSHAKICFCLSACLTCASVYAEGFATTGGFDVKPLTRFDVEVVGKNDWPRVKPPITFNRNFTIPSRVWRVTGGYMATFDRGEFGASLFYVDSEGKQWTRVLNTHIQDLVKLDKDTFVVAGGLAHLTSYRGTVYILARDKHGGWATQKVISASHAVPSIAGMTMTSPLDVALSHKLIAISFSDDISEFSLLGVGRNGTIHLLGKPLNKK